MIYTKLSTADVKVSKACLGTMSFGAHVTEEAAFKIMDRALELGINFFDTAELYAVPTSPETYGLTEEIIGKWMKSRNARKKIILATKVVGPNHGWLGHIREGRTQLNEKNITKALEASLKRLRTEYIDLYQLHWPDRNVQKFEERNFVFKDDEVNTPIEETLSVLQKLQKEGKIKNIGISNETPWGTMEYLKLSREKGLPRAVSVQNIYNLLTRNFETAMSEISHRENIGLLAYSPLGYGALGGRYLDGNLPKGGRFTKYPDFVPRYRTPLVEGIIKQYKSLAEENNMTLPQMALAFVYGQTFLTSCIIGPATVEQLEEDVEAMNIKLSDEILVKIDEINEQCPNPCP